MLPWSYSGAMVKYAGFTTYFAIDVNNGLNNRNNIEYSEIKKVAS